MNPPSALIVFCTCPDEATAARLASLAVEAGAAACVNLLPGLTSVYRWQGAVERAQEVLLLAKTTAAGYARLESLWRTAHPYELPELLAVPACAGLPPYLQWITDAVTP